MICGDKYVTEVTCSALACLGSRRLYNRVRERTRVDTDTLIDTFT